MSGDYSNVNPEEEDRIEGLFRDVSPDDMTLFEPPAELWASINNEIRAGQVSMQPGHEPPLESQRPPRHRNRCRRHEP